MPPLPPAVQQVVHADDVNAPQAFPSVAADASLFAALRSCQAMLHAWGRANGVRFDASKESMHIVSRAHPVGVDFQILGVNFDSKLIMDSAVEECATQAAWRLRTLLRTQRYHTVPELIMLFRCHIMSYVDYRSVAVAHASTSVLMNLARIYEGSFGASPWQHEKLCCTSGFYPSVCDETLPFSV